MTDSPASATGGTIALGPGEGRRIRVFDATMTVKAGGHETGGAFDAIEVLSPPGEGPPLHLHRRHEEAFFVLDGEFTFRSGEELVKLTPGGFLYVPRDTVHSYQNTGRRRGRLFVVLTPGGNDRFFAELGALPPGPPDMARITPIFERYDLELVGPPLSLV